MGDNGCPFRIKPLIAVRVIEVPVCVDQVLDRIAAKAVYGFENSRPGYSDRGIDEYLAVGTRDNRNITARALENADIAAQLVDLDGRLGGVVTDQIHDVAGLGVGLLRAEPASGGCKSRARHAAETKLTT